MGQSGYIRCTTLHGLGMNCVIQDRQTYKRNIEARSRHHCCRGKPKTITYPEQVPVALVNQQCNAHAPYYIICDLPGSTIFYHVIS